jgi:hypothetical protein
VATGTVLVDFGAYPGQTEAQVAVTGQGSILTSSLVEAWLMPDATTDHTEDDHLVDGPTLTVPKSLIVAATGFTIKAQARDLGGRAYGKWNVAWAWA